MSGAEDVYLLNPACWRLVTVYHEPSEAKTSRLMIQW